MEMHQLRYFVAVAQASSFSRAAEACFVSQPSLSQQIAKLEAEVGQRLLDRLGRRVQLTDAGRQLLDSALAILATVEDAKRRMKDDGNLAGCRLTVGVIPTIAPYLLPAVLGSFEKRHPGVEMTIHEDVTRNLVGAVMSGEVDLAVMGPPIADDEHLETESLWTEALLLAMPRGHRLSRVKQITMENLREERFLILAEMHCLGEQVLSYCRAHECQPRIVCRSAQIATMQALVEQGLGVTLLPEMAVRKPSKSIVYRRLAGTGPSRTITVIWRKHRYHSVAAMRFLEGLRAAGRHVS